MIRQNLEIDFLLRDNTFPIGKVKSVMEVYQEHFPEESMINTNKIFW